MIEIGEAQTTEDTEMLIRWLLVKKTHVWDLILDGFGGSDVEDMNNSMESLDPKGLWEACLKQESPYRIVDGTNHSLGPAILLGGVWTREPD